MYAGRGRLVEQQGGAAGLCNSSGMLGCSPSPRLCSHARRAGPDVAVGALHQQAQRRLLRTQALLPADGLQPLRQALRLRGRQGRTAAGGLLFAGWAGRVKKSHTQAVTSLCYKPCAAQAAQHLAVHSSAEEVASGAACTSIHAQIMKVAQGTGASRQAWAAPCRHPCPTCGFLKWNTFATSRSGRSAGAYRSLHMQMMGRIRGRSCCRGPPCLPPLPPAAPAMRRPALRAPAPLAPPPPPSSSSSSLSDASPPCCAAPLPPCLPPPALPGAALMILSSAAMPLRPSAPPAGGARGQEQHVRTARAQHKAQPCLLAVDWP